MGAIAGLDAYINRLTGGNSGTPEQIWFWKGPRIGGGSVISSTPDDRWTDLWLWDGIPGAGAAPGTTGAATDNTTAGGLKQSDPAGGRQKWLTAFVVESEVAGTFMLYDRLAHDGGFSGTDTAAQTVSFAPPSRYSDGVGNAIFVIISTAIGNTLTTFTCDYTNTADEAKTSRAQLIGGTNDQEAGRLIMVPLADGDTGVKNVTNFDLLASTGTAGDISVVLAHPLAYTSFRQAASASAGPHWSGDLVTGVPMVTEIKTDACLVLAHRAQTTTVPSTGWFGYVSMLED